MKTRKLRNLTVSAIGYGCMGLSHGYGAIPPEEESIRLIRRAYELGCTFFDTAEGYSMGHNEQLVGRALESVRNHVVIATKLHIRNERGEKLKQQIEGRLDASLKKLRTDHIDLYYQHPVNKDIPVEEVAEIMGELIKKGKILDWGQSQALPDEIRRANAVTPLTAVQSEYSIMERMFEKRGNSSLRRAGRWLCTIFPSRQRFSKRKIWGGQGSADSEHHRGHQGREYRVSE